MGSQMALAEMPRPCTTYMGCHLAFVGKRKMQTQCMDTTGLQLEATWTAYGKPRGSWQPALFWPVMCLLVFSGETSGPTNLAFSCPWHGLCQWKWQCQASS